MIFGSLGACLYANFLACVIPTSCHQAGEKSGEYLRRDFVFNRQYINDYNNYFRRAIELSRV